MKKKNNKQTMKKQAGVPFTYWLTYLTSKLYLTSSNFSCAITFIFGLIAVKGMNPLPYQ